MMAFMDIFKGMDAKSWGEVIGGGVAAYGKYEQGKAANKMAKLQLQDYNDEKKRKKRTQDNLNNAYARLPITD